MLRRICLILSSCTLGFVVPASTAHAVCPGGGNCSTHGTCVAGLVCSCDIGFAAPDCGSCATNYYNYPTCTFCQASTTCNGHGVCSGTGSCVCNAGWTGPNCNQCAEGYYGASCLACPGGVGANQCNGNGTCNDGTFGTGACTCFNANYNGTACQYTRATTCNGHGNPTFSGGCTCDTGFDPATNCSSCLPNYYGYPACTFCTQSTTCSSHGVCTTSGTCACDVGFAGPACNTCGTDFYNYPACTYCTAAVCSNHGTCSPTGGCVCSTGYTGSNCNVCAANYYNYPTCTYCLASTTCTGHGVCTSSGNCVCNTGFTGPNCSACATNYYNYPTCTFCQASTTCNGHGTCTGTGSCVCNTAYAGTNCSTCATNYYNYPTCTFCLASSTCSSNGTCNSSGGCDCLPGWTGANCNTPTVPSVTQWRSVRLHGGSTLLSIVLNPTATGNGSTGPTVETRQGGIQLVYVDLNRSVTLVDSTSVIVSGRDNAGGTAFYMPTVSMIDADTMQLTFAPGLLPDQVCYTITVGASTFAEGITGDNDVKVRSLVGDTTMNGKVNLSDAILVAVRAAASVTAATSPATDLNLSGGTITLADALVAKSQVASPAHQTTCP